MKNIRQWVTPLLLTICTQITAQTVVEEIKAIPQCSAGIIYSLPAGKHQADTPAPDGKKPFYISHFGSCAAYYLESPKDYEVPINAFVKADSMNMLTPLGDSWHRTWWTASQISLWTAAISTLAASCETTPSCPCKSS